jgi:hypothetical protein
MLMGLCYGRSRGEVVFAGVHSIFDGDCSVGWRRGLGGLPGTKKGRPNWAAFNSFPNAISYFPLASMLSVA